MKTKTVVGLGEVLWDVFPEGKKLGGAEQFRLASMSVVFLNIPLKKVWHGIISCITKH